ncbi:MAG TPA: ribosome silencing factor [Rubrivivax sp.]|nr:ribosome silencing factor [Rubrivivax sp.]
MDIRKLQRAIVDGLEDVKAQAIAVYNTEALSPLFERVIIATGTSNRQTKALAASVRDKVRERGLAVMRTEGQENGEWIIVDCGAAVVHIMQPAIRDYYHLEEIWGGKTVKMKFGATAGQGLVKASEPMADDAPAAAPAPRKTPGRASPKVAAKTAAKSAAKSAVKTAAKTPARSPAKAPAKNKPTARRAPAPRQPPAKGGVRTVVAGAPAKKSAARGSSAATRSGAGASRRRA